MELLPRDQIAFQRMLDAIRAGYESFGYLPIETPVMEFTDILLTKSGGETERQVYFVQSTGNRQAGREADLALRFDLTVPLARYVAEHENELLFPFRRYQIQRVYRGESAQRGRFREFYQCDVDVIGKGELDLQFDAEIPAVIYQVFKTLDIGDFTIHLNNRKVMQGLMLELGLADPQLQTLVMREVDKLDKVGPGKVVAVLCGEGFGLDRAVVERLMDFVSLRADSNDALLGRVAGLGIGNALFQEGLTELRQVTAMIRAQGVPEKNFTLNVSIARGLDYYTGTVYETLLDAHPEIGSICSGGRYDNLAGYYTDSHLPGVGISIGATRLFYQLKEAGLVRAAESTVQVLVTSLDANLAPANLALATLLRQGGLNTEVYHGALKFGKQLKYADRAGIRFAVIQGGDEAAKGTVTVKDLQRSEQFEAPRAEAAAAICQRLRP